MEPEQTAASSSKLILSIIVILVVVGVAYALFRSNDMTTDENATTTPATTTATVAEDGSFTGNMFDLVSTGGSRKCTWSGVEGGMPISGTVYVDRGKFKTDAEVRSGGTTVVTHAIGDGEYIYSWTNVTNTGVKMPMSQAQVPAQGTVAQERQFTSTYNFSCDPWNADSRTFAIPSGVTFTEFGATTTVQ